MTVIEQYVQNMNGLTTFSADFLPDVVKLIESVGFTLTEGDLWLLGFCTKSVEQEIFNGCNVSSVPEGLYSVAAGLICAEFVQAKKTRGELPSSMDFQPILKKIEEGDTSIEYVQGSVTSGEQRLDLFLNRLYNGRKQFIRFRKIQW